MIAELILRLRPRPGGAGVRTEVCPPALRPAGTQGRAAWRRALHGWLAAGGLAPGQGAGTTLTEGTRRVREEFLDALHDVRSQQAGMLLARIRGARNLRELWHLRPDVFNLVAQHYDQSEAQTRLDRLNRHFPTRSPRSGFAPLSEPPARRARQPRA